MLAVIITLVLFSVVSGFQSLSGLGRLATVAIRAQNYQQLLEQAKQRKLATKANPIAQQVVPRTSTNADKTSSGVAIGSAAIGDSDYPFSDEMYEHLKFVITKLTHKIKSDTSLTPEELDRFEDSVIAILLDATGVSAVSADITDQFGDTENDDSSYSEISDHGASAHDVADHAQGIETANYLSEAQDQSQYSGRAFDSFKGLGSTWRVPGMDSMTTEEYYDALNKRNSQIRAARKATESRYHMDDFLNNLTRKS